MVYKQVVPALLIAMEDFSNPRVQAHAGAAMVNFVELCPKNILNQYTDLLVSKLEQILSVKLEEVNECGVSWSVTDIRVSIVT